MRNDSFFRKFTVIIALLALVVELAGVAFSNQKLFLSGIVVLAAMFILVFVNIWVEIQTQKDIDNYRKSAK